MNKKETAKLEIVSNANDEFVLDSRLNCKQVIIVTSSEGGVLKSTNADKFLSRAREEGYKLAFYDGNPSNEYSNKKIN